MRFEEASASCPLCGSEELGVGEITTSEWRFSSDVSPSLLPDGIVREEFRVDSTYFFCVSCGERFQPRNLGEEQFLEDLLALGLLKRYPEPRKPALCGTCFKWGEYETCKRYREEGLVWECDMYVRRDTRRQAPGIGSDSGDNDSGGAEGAPAEVVP